MGSDSDLPVMQAAVDVLTEFGVAHEVRIVSAHRTPDAMATYARTAASRGLRVIVAGAGGAAHLPGMTASMTPLPVIGVPVPLAHLDGLDSLLSIVQMPKGIPVATVAVGNAANAGLLAIRILATSDDALRARMETVPGRPRVDGAREGRQAPVAGLDLKSGSPRTVKRMIYRSYGEFRDIPHVVVDGSAQPGTVLTLSHWPGSATPERYRADLSAEIAFTYAADPDPSHRRGVRHQQPLRPGRARQRVRAHRNRRRVRPARPARGRRPGRGLRQLPPS